MQITAARHAIRTDCGVAVHVGNTYCGLLVTCDATDSNNRNTVPWGMPVRARKIQCFSYNYTMLFIQFFNMCCKAMSIKCLPVWVTSKVWETDCTESHISFLKSTFNIVHVKIQLTAILLLQKQFPWGYYERSIKRQLMCYGSEQNIIDTNSSFSVGFWPYRMIFRLSQNLEINFRTQTIYNKQNKVTPQPNTDFAVTTFYVFCA